MDKEKIKEHFKKNYKTYLAGIVSAGITALVMRSNIARGAMGETSARGALGNTASFIFRNKQTINVTTVLDRDGRGHPGWPVRNVDTGRIFFSQKDAARAFDIPEKVLSGHLRGKFSDVDGLHFERVSLN